MTETAAPRPFRPGVRPGAVGFGRLPRSLLGVLACIALVASTTCCGSTKSP